MVIFLDSDDWIIPECIALMIGCVNKHSDVELFQGGALSINRGFVK